MRIVIAIEGPHRRGPRLSTVVGFQSGSALTIADTTKLWGYFWQLEHYKGPITHSPALMLIPPGQK